MTNRPASDEGKRLLAHELVHGTQQDSSGASPTAPRPENFRNLQTRLQFHRPAIFRKGSGGNAPQGSFREVLVAASSPFSIGVVQELAEDALDRASSWAFSLWAGNRSVAIQSLNMGTADAMRHAYWCAGMTLALGEKTASRFATAHEMPFDRLTGNERLLAEMDLFNNEVGRQVGETIARCHEAEGQSARRRLDQPTRNEVWDQVTLARIAGKLKAIPVDPVDGTWNLGTIADPLAF